MVATASVVRFRVGVTLPAALVLEAIIDGLDIFFKLRARDPEPCSAVL